MAAVRGAVTGDAATRHRVLAQACLGAVLVITLSGQEPPSPAGEQQRLALESEVLAKRGKFADAIALQAQAVALDNQNPEMLYALAQRYAAARRDADAMKYLGDAIAKDPARFRKRAAADAWFARLSKRADFQRLTRPPR